MSVLSMLKKSVTKIFSGWKLRSRRAAVAVILIVVAVIGFFFLRSGETAPEIKPGLPQVGVISVADYAEGALGVAVPTANGNSFVIRSEAGGKVTRAAERGRVEQGTIVAQLENSAQRAALTQAEGAYEAAAATAGVNETSQETARKDAVVTWTSTTVSAAKVIRTSIDTYYGVVRGPQGASGFQLEAYGAADDFNTARTAVEKIFDRWETEQVTETNSAAKLTELSSDLSKIGSLVDRIAAIIPRQPISAIYSEDDRTDDATSVATARASITTLVDNVNTVRTALSSASNTGSASAQAGVKQALGALEAAQSAYEKTVIRAPFAGTLVAVNVRSGDVILTGNDIAIITPQEGVKTSRSFALPLSAVKYSPAGAFVFLVNTDGILESREVQTGLVTANSISVEGLEGTEQIVKDVRGLKSGEAVVIIEP